MVKDEEILEAVLEEFSQLAKIPRPSGHEQAVSNHLKQAFTKLGCKVVQDEAYNIIADLEATPGYEKAPRTILQGHMDMVCVADEGVAYDPENDPIRLVRTAEYLLAEGTSLGSDDGTGVAEILYLFRHAPEPHGPLRAIVTVDEETGMSGAQRLDAEHLSDADFYINCDSEEEDLLTVGSAGGLDMEYRRPVHWRAADTGKAWRLTVGGLRGGHSGERINDGRGNAIQVMAQLLLDMLDADIVFSAASLEGGTARNAIPASASMIFLTGDSEEKMRRVMATRRQKFLASYGSVDPDMTLTLAPADMPERVMAAEDVKAAAELILALHSGVYAMSPYLPGLVETSANLGLLRTAKDAIWFTCYPRSSVDAKLEDFQRLGAILGERFGCPARIGTPFPAWPERPESRLSKLVTDVFRDQQKKEMRVAAIHAGLECSFIAKKNPKIDIVSIGVTTLDIHSPRERLVLATVAPQVRLIAETLRRIAAGRF